MRAFHLTTIAGFPAKILRFSLDNHCLHFTNEVKPSGNKELQMREIVFILEPNSS
jgi:hypothetical protein